MTIERSPARRAAALPDIADDDFRRRLDPLARAVVPSSAPKAEPEGGQGFPQEGRNSGIPNIQISGLSGGTVSGDLAERIAAATQLEELRAARGPKRGVEFVLPQRVVSALKTAAAAEGTSMTVKVLEALRVAGYPVTDTDFIDLRKLPKR